MTRSEQVPELVDHLFRRAAGQMVSTLVRILGSAQLDLAEDVVQDALLKALEQWPFRGVPANPTAWLIEVAKNKALDKLRRDSSLTAKRADLLAAFPAEIPAQFDVAGPFRDDQLAMMFLCCHPEIPPEARAALTLKTVGGFSVPEIARAFLSEEPAIAQRIVRAKRQIRDRSLNMADMGATAGAALLERLDSVLEVLYLMFNEGYLSSGARSSGSTAVAPQILRDDLCNEAIRLARMLSLHAVTGVPKVHALLALFLLQSSRFPARLSSEGDLLTLAEQDRSLWDRRRIEEGLLELSESAEGEEESQYHIEAAIAAAHAVSPAMDQTDWHYVMELYDALYQRKPTPVVGLNRAVAVAYSLGPLAGIQALQQIANHSALAGYYLLPATQAHLWELAGDTAKASYFYNAALGCECTPPERRLLETRLERLRN